jgi:hypothetical protein
MAGNSSVLNRFVFKRSEKFVPSFQGYSANALSNYRRLLSMPCSTQSDVCKKKLPCLPDADASSSCNEGTGHIRMEQRNQILINEVIFWRSAIWNGDLASVKHSHRFSMGYDKKQVHVDSLDKPIEP